MELLVPFANFMYVCFNCPVSTCPSPIQLLHRRPKSKSCRSCPQRKFYKAVSSTLRASNPLRLIKHKATFKQRLMVPGLIPPGYFSPRRHLFPLILSSTCPSMNGLFLLILYMIVFLWDLGGNVKQVLAHTVYCDGFIPFNTTGRSYWFSDNNYIILILTLYN